MRVYTLYIIISFKFWSGLVRICQLWSGLVRICQFLVRTGRDLRFLVGIGQDFSILVGIGREITIFGRDWSGLVRICHNWSGLVGLFKFGRDIPKVVRICTFPASIGGAYWIEKHNAKMEVLLIFLYFLHKHKKMKKCERHSITRIPFSSNQPAKESRGKFMEIR